MQWLSMKWRYFECHHTDKLAHKFALQDYGMLIDLYVTNLKAQNFLQLHNRHTVKRFLWRSCYSKGNIKYINKVS